MRTPIAAISLLIPLTLLACEEKGIPAPAADTAQAEETAQPAPADSAATEGEQPEEKAAKDEDAEKKADEDAEEDGGDEEKQAAEGEDEDGTKAGATNGTKTAKTGDAKKPEKKEDEPEPVKGEKKTASSYAAWLQSSGKYQVDKPGAVVAVVNAQGEYKCNDKYPYKFKVGGAPAGVTFASTTVRGASVGKKSTSLRIPFTPTSAGSKTISGTFYFSVCNADTCQIKKQPMSVTVNVE